MDGMQAIALGLLRGLLDTGVPMVMAALSYWAVGVPTSYILGFRAEMGGVGVWIGLILGLSTAGVLLCCVFGFTHYGVSRPLHRGMYRRAMRWLAPPNAC